MAHVSQSHSEGFSRTTADFTHHDEVVASLIIPLIPDPCVHPIACPDLIEIGMGAIGQLMEPLEMQFCEDRTEPDRVTAVLRGFEVATRRQTVSGRIAMTSASDDPLWYADFWCGQEVHRINAALRSSVVPIEAPLDQVAVRVV